MGVNVGHLHKKRIVRDTSGQIIDLFDETDGGWIIQRRQIVNPAKWGEILKREKDKQEAAKAHLHEKRDANAPDRTSAPSQVDALKKEMADFKKDVDDKFNAIMAALKK